MRQPTVFAALVLLAFLCGCDEERGPTLLQQWQSEADAHGPMGSEGSFRLEGATTLVGPTAALGVVTAPFTATLTIEELARGGVTAPADCGPTLIESGSIDLGAAEVIELVSGEGDVEGSGAVRLTIATATLLTASALALPAGACSLRDGTLVEEALLVDGAVRVSALGTSAALTTRVADLAIAGTGTVGTVGTARVGAIEHSGVTAVMGFEATTELDPATASAAGTARVTQILDADGALLAADVELALNAAVARDADADAADDADADGDERVRITKGDVASIAVSFREKSYTGDGLLAVYEVTGADAGKVQIAAAPPTGAVAGLIDALDGAGAATPIVAIVVVATLPLAALVDAIDTIFGSEPPTPVPLPSYIRAGEIGTFTVVIDGDDGVGVHEAALVVVGQNYDGANVPLRWEIVEED